MRDQPGGEEFLRALLARLLPAAARREPVAAARGPAPARGIRGATTTKALARWREGSTGYPDRRRGHAAARARGLAPEPRAAHRRVVPHEDARPGLAPRRRALRAAARRCRRREQRRQLAVDRRDRYGHAAEPRSQSRRGRRSVTTRTGCTYAGTCPSSRRRRSARTCTSRGRRRQPRLPRRTTRRRSIASMPRLPDGWRPR